MGKMRRNGVHRMISFKTAAMAVALIGMAGMPAPAYAAGQSDPGAITAPRGATNPMTPQGRSNPGTPARIDPDLATAKEMLGKPVNDEAGNELGEVDDVVLNPSNKPSRVIITSGGFLGIGSKEVALPWNSMAYDPAQKIVRVRALDKKQFERLSAYVKSDSSNLLSEQVKAEARKNIQIKRDAGRAPAPDRMPIPGK